MIKNFLTVLGLALLIPVSAATAQTCANYPNTLANGQNADANQVMANFNHVRSCVNSAPPPSGLDDATRRNILLNTAFIAKFNAGLVRNLNTFADGYKGTDGVNAGASTNFSINTGSGYLSPSAVAGDTPSYSNPGGTGDRTASIAVTTNLGIVAGVVTNTVNGVVNNDAGSSVNFSGEPWDGTKFIQFDFGVGASKHITEATWKQAGTQSSATHGITQWQGSNDSTNWSNIGPTFTLGGTTQVQTQLSGNTAGYRYYRLNGVSGAISANPWVGEIEFKIDNFVSGTTNNMTAVTTMQAADAAVSNGRVLLEYNPVGTLVLNTDLTAEVTCNNGTNWASMTLTDVGAGQGGRRVAETADTACTSGTAFAARLKSLNAKNVQIFRATLTVH